MRATSREWSDKAKHLGNNGLDPSEVTGRLSTQPESARLVALGPPFEGDGWVNWSGLATVLAGTAERVAGCIQRLLGVTVSSGVPFDMS
jgi:hypothetical protein